MANVVMGLTQAGLKLYGKVQRGDTKLEITRVIAGSGYMSEGETVEEIPAVKNPVDVTVSITEYNIIGDGQTALYISFGRSETDYELREIGVMAKDPDEGEILYSYCNFGERADHIDAYSSSYAVSQEGVIYTAIGNASELTVNVEGAAQVTRAEFLEHTNDKSNPHQVTAAQVGFTNKDVLDRIDNAALSDWDSAADNSHTHGNKGILDTITQTLINTWNGAVSHITNKNNPHNVTKAQVGLGNVTNESKADMFKNSAFTGETETEDLTVHGYLTASDVKGVQVMQFVGSSVSETVSIGYSQVKRLSDGVTIMQRNGTPSDYPSDAITGMPGDFWINVLTGDIYLCYTKNANWLKIGTAN